MSKRMATSSSHKLTLYILISFTIHLAVNGHHISDDPEVIPHQKVKQVKQSKWRCSEDSDCPLWAYCNGSTCKCKQSFNSSDEVKCSNSLRLSIHKGSCITYDNKTRELIYGGCIEHAHDINNNQMYYDLPYNLSKLNKFMCEDKWNKIGRLCGKCLPGHAPLAYSYDMRCVSCPEGNKNVWKYLLMAYGPLTIFYFIVLFFKINATSSHLHGYLYFSQTLSVPILIRYIYIQQDSASRKLEFNILIAFYSIWNLDILRSLHPEICLNVSTLTLFAMDYALALYPLLLTVISYILIELHDKDYRMVVYLWKPFRYFFSLVRRNWNIRTTVIDAYATFFLLSSMKILYTTVEILDPTTATSLISGKTTWVLYFDGTVDYFGPEHLPYATLAITLCIILTIIPTLLLLLYPFRWFQRLISYLKLQGPLLRTVMDSFQGCYKDGTTEPGMRDYRWFAAMPVLIRIPCFILSATLGESSFYPWGITVVCIILLLLIVIQPYKANVAHYTKIDAIFLGMLIILFAMIDNNNLAGVSNRSSYIVMFTLVPLIYMTCATLYWIFTKMKTRTCLALSCLKGRFGGYSRIESDDIPDRLAHPEQYTQNHLNNPVVNSLPSRIQDEDTY